MAIHPSPRFVFLLLFSHSLAAAVASSIVLSFPIKVVISLLVLVSLFWHLARDALLLLPNSWCELSLNQGELSIVRRDATVLVGKVSGGSVVCPYFVLLHIRQEGKRWSLSRVIFPDALERDVFRDLCVRLRLG